ncbi:MAG: hypothetical protein Q7S09_03910 [bacterium]|nr:hypothetical protein [bacterium]
MHEGKAKGSELIIFDDGTLYHIDIGRKDNIPPNLFLVGASERVDAISKHFDEVYFSHRNSARPEFYVVCGMYNGVPMAAMSIGIGCDNTEIVLNELHALFEYDHVKDAWDMQDAKVNIIRVGTCGAFQEKMPTGSIAISEYSLGLDNLGAYYPTPQKDKKCASIEESFLRTPVGKVSTLSYCSRATPHVAELLKKTAYRLGEHEDAIYTGITTSAPGFFGPEGRSIGRIKTTLNSKEFLDTVRTFDNDGTRIINTEMESSILFRIAHEILGYNVGTLCLVVDNIFTNEVILSDVAKTRMDACIKIALETMTSLSKEA